MVLGEKKTEEFEKAKPLLISRQSMVRGKADVQTQFYQASRPHAEQSCHAA